MAMTCTPVTCDPVPAAQALFAERVDQICHQLFELWCERKSVIALGYLLHRWPLIDRGPGPVFRLTDTLNELFVGHPDAFRGLSARALDELVDCLDNLIVRQAYFESIRSDPYGAMGLSVVR
jgi:hypothetical protein